jgi:NAD(P)-dependent dehydrogenase (short-subunit alcohol dehydrogenase family)
MKAVVFGGATGMGLALARRMATRGDEVFLLGIDAELLAHGAAELQARHPRRAPVGWALCDLERPEGFAAALDEADAALGDFDTVVVTAAMFATQEELEADVELARRLLVANHAHTVAFCERARRRLVSRGGGRLVVFSSVAGDRGRKPVGIYGSSKAGLSAYLEALDHALHGTGTSVTCVKPGFVKTGMTARLPVPPFAGEPDGVAKEVLQAVDERRPVVYAPAIWSPIMRVVRLLPRWVMRRAAF